MQKDEATRRWTSARRCVRSAAGAALLSGLFIMGSAGSALAQFNSGSSGVHGAFPPAPEPASIPSDYTYLVWNMRTGHVWYCSTYTPGTGLDGCSAGSGINVEAQIANIPPRGLTTGVYEFTNVAISTIFLLHRYVVVVGASPNTPLTILSQNDINFTGQVNGSTVNLLVRGWDGNTPLNQSQNLICRRRARRPRRIQWRHVGQRRIARQRQRRLRFRPGGAGGSAGADDPRSPHRDPGTGVRPRPVADAVEWRFGGGGGAGVGPAPIAQGRPASPTGYGGGGGGNILLLAASNRVTLGQYAVIQALGVTGGSSSANCGFGGGGAGGSVRIVANDFRRSRKLNVPERPEATARTSPRADSCASKRRFDMASDRLILGSASGSFISFPTARFRRTLSLRITSIQRAAAPTTPTASLAVPDILFASAP